VPEDHTLEPFTRAADELAEMAREWLYLLPQATSQADHWLKVLGQVQAHLTEDHLRAAVVGTVKSGKSTLVNALVGQDLLRRGAGILTAMITRVQPGPQPRALLRFKDWSDISEEIRRALALFPGGVKKARGAPFDLRQAEDRELLLQALAAGERAELWSGGSLNQEWLLLKSYLEGYDQVKDVLQGSDALTLTGADLARHGDLVTREATAVYLKDVLLTLPAPWLPRGLELGDCQGSDSPIPQHLAQVLAYLVKSDLVFYVISSRVGLRQGDFLFLTELKRMGFLPHAYFLLNLDLAEHRNLEEIQTLMERTRRELAPLAPEAPLFAFSALEILLKRRREGGETLEPREVGLLSVWEADPGATAFSQGEFRRFGETLAAGLEQLREQRLAGGAFSQVLMVARGLREQVELALGLFGKDLAVFQNLEERLAERRQPLKTARRSLAQALAGSGEHLKATLKKRVGSFLDNKSGQGAALLDFIQDYAPNWEELAPEGGEEALRPALYRLFQKFQKDLGRFAAGELTGRTLEFVRAQEEWLRQELLTAAAPLFLALQDALAQYYREIGALGLPAAPPRLKVELPPNPQDLEVPLFPLDLPETDWRWTGEAWLRSGAGWLTRAWEAVKARLGREAVTDPRGQLLRSLERALGAIKDRLLEEARLNLLDFGERLKFRYFFPLVDRLTASLEAHLDNLLQSLLADLEGVTEALRQAGADREARRHRLAALAYRARLAEEGLGGGGGQGTSFPRPSPQNNHNQNHSP